MSLKSLHRSVTYVVFISMSACLRTGHDLPQSDEALLGGKASGGVRSEGGSAGANPGVETCTVGLGACRAEGVLVDTATGPQCDAAVLLPQEERCNEPGAPAEDEDCDGRVNEGLDLTECPVCEAGVTPTAERCDNLDNDCDGLVDERLTTPGRLFRGVCAVEEAKIRCINGEYVDPDYDQIEGYDGPEELRCDGQDNDCDGEVDEGVLALCMTCTEVRVEVCDGQDNDCDGRVDEGCVP